MKLLFENWRRYLKENKNKIYYWQTTGPWKGDSEIQFAVTHVPKANPRPDAGGLIEEWFEETRRKVTNYAPSRLNSVFLCEGLGGSNYCAPGAGGGDTYLVKIELLSWHFKPFKADSMWWTEAVRGYEKIQKRGGDNWATDSYDWVKEMATEYLKVNSTENPAWEIIVSPPDAAIIVEKYEK